jgi:hypothetical protein
VKMPVAAHVRIIGFVATKATFFPNPENMFDQFGGFLNFTFVIG